MRRILTSLLLLSLSLLVACSGDDVARDTGPAGDTKTTRDMSPPDKEVAKKDSGPDKPKPDAARAASVCGWMANEQGIKLVGVGIIACNDHECHSATSTATGSFCLQVDVAADYVFHVTETKISGKDYGEVAVLGRGGQCPRKPGEIGMHALRVGDTVGDHTVHFGNLGETITIAHSAHTRDTFARGALRAAKWVAGKTAGLYSMHDVLGI